MKTPNFRRHHVAAAVAGAVLALGATQALATGFQLNEQSASGIGNAFAGGKLMLASWGTLRPLVSVGIIALCISSSVVASLWANRRDARRTAPAPRIPRTPLQDPQPGETSG